jgi:DNA-binding NtrC family response regulator
MGARGAGLLGMLTEGRCQLDARRALPLGICVGLTGGDADERQAWSRALVDAGARVVEAGADPDGPVGPADLAIVVGGGPVDGTPSVVVCDQLDPTRVSTMLRAGALDILVRPVTAAQVVEACRLAAARLPARPARRRRRPTGIDVEGAIGAALARTRLPVLITGETGTGKSRMAKKLHDTLTPGAPFVEVNAAGLAPSLLTSELFGHERGAFTGAHTAKPGLAGLAHGGTLFLDEIGELAPDAQAQLLSFLDRGTFRPVGGVREIRSDARIVCATNRDLLAQVTEGRFREDLYYRLASIVVPLPPLRDAADRIPDLVLDLARAAAEKAGLRAPAFADAALIELAACAWPGNVRQLRFVVERLVALYDGELITADAVAPLLGACGRGRAPAAASVPVVDLDTSTRRVRSLAEVERDMVQRAMAQTGGNRTRAAELLGITPRGLYNKLRRCGTNFRVTEE